MRNKTGEVEKVVRGVKTGEVEKNVVRGIKQVRW